MKTARAIGMMRTAGASIRFGWPRAIYLVVAGVLIVQLVRLFWVILTPVGPLGDWRGRHANLPSATMRAELFRGFDAFFPSPQASDGEQNVTSLALTLFGVRVNEGSGLGSAIIAGADGVQNSYAVGDEIVPGVTLKEVLFDHVVIGRGGVEESIFLDQSTPAQQAVPAQNEDEARSNGAFRSADGAGPARPAASSLTVEALKAGVGFGPRMSNGRITGIIVSQKGPGFDAAGFRAGDVITQVNGRAIGSADDLSVLQQALKPGARISVMVERGAEVVPVALLVQGQ